MDPDLDRESLLNALLMCDETVPTDASGIGGPIYTYIHTGEGGGFIRHPGLPNANLELRAAGDVRWLMDQGYIQVREWGDDHRSFTFEVTDAARNQRTGER